MVIGGAEGTSLRLCQQPPFSAIADHATTQYFDYQSIKSCSHVLPCSPLTPTRVRAANRLNALKVQKAKGPATLDDGNGLRLLINEQGHKLCTGMQF